MHDLIIRGGTLVDGTGADRFTGDVAVTGDRITAVGKVQGKARREIDADGLLVTPGWVDIHTHYDGQAMWDPYLSPSSWHGCTTVVMGNCGVGFAPVARGTEDWLIELMESVEDIPGSALAEGLNWNWETFPEYMDALGRQQRAIDVGTQVPHCAVRAYVMKERCMTQHNASEADIKAMSDIVREGLRAGALGFSTSRSIVHLTKDGVEIPGTYAGEAELYGIAHGMREAGHGVFQLASDLGDRDGDLRWMSELSRTYGLPVSVLLFQTETEPTKYRDILKGVVAAGEQGAQLFAQISSRTAGLLFSLDGMHPFQCRSAYLELGDLPREERLRRMRNPQVKAAILASADREMSSKEKLFLKSNWRKMFRMGDKPNYEPELSESFASRAEREGVAPEELAYDTLLEFDGRGVIYAPALNYASGSLDACLEMMRHPNVHFSGSDAGAHCGIICDASLPTFNLAFWCRDRTRGEQLPIEFVVHKQTMNAASLHGLNDRGVIKPGYRADFNIIDFHSLNVDAPRIVFDLPTDARRLVQTAQGYRYTIKSGQVISENGEATGAMPGQLIRGPQRL